MPPHLFNTSPGQYSTVKKEKKRESIKMGQEGLSLFTEDYDCVYRNPNKYVNIQIKIFRKVAGYKSVNLKNKNKNKNCILYAVSYAPEQTTHNF